MEGQARPATAFISYAHEDQDFVVTLANDLQSADLNVVYDQVILRVGDSLSRSAGSQRRYVTETS